MQSSPLITRRRSGCWNAASEASEHKTVNYHCLWDFTYRSAGETPPSNAKSIVDATPMKMWLSAQSPRQMEIIRRRVGYKFGLQVKAEVKPTVR